MSEKLSISAPSDGVLSSGEPSSTTVNQTVTFHEDDSIVVKEFPRYVSIGESFKDAALEQRMHDIKDFLGRPVLCKSGTYTSTQTPGTILQQIPLPSSCLANASYGDKIRGFYGFRAKMICRVQVNSQRFQQGRLLLHYLPQTDTMHADRKACALSNLVLITQQPRVDFDLAKDTEVILEIPYVSNSLYYSLADGSFDFGTFYLTVYASLYSGSGATNCSYSIWCHFEDVELQYPAVSQSGIKILKARGKGAQQVSVTDAELKNEGLGPISSVMSRMSNAASVLAEVPLITAFAAPTSWALGVMGRAADALGFSKPTNAAADEKRSLVTFSHMNNVNSVDNSVKMSLRSDNAVAQLPGFAGTDIDEMSIPYLVSIPSWIITKSWSTNDVVGTLVYTLPLNTYGNGYGQNPTIAGTAYQMYSYPVYGFLANNFQLWRGSITMTLKIVRTEFHSGRLLIAFFPGKNLTNGTNTNFANAQYVYREVLDLRTSNEVSITFPYTALTPYLDAGDSYGLVQVFVLNPLVAPATISTTCDVLVELSGAPDFEFAAPRNGSIGPVVYRPQSGIVANASTTNPTMASTVSNVLGAVTDHLTPIFRPQSGIATSKKIESVMDNSKLDVGIEPSLYCIGERVQSIRQLIKRFSTIYKCPGLTQNYIMTVPQVNYVPSLTPAGPNTQPGHVVDSMSYYASMFRFWRGAVRIKFIDPVSASPIFTAVGYNATAYGPVSIPGSATGPTGTTCDQPTVVVPSLSGGAEYEIPYYSMTHTTHVRLVPGSTLRESVDNQMNLYVTQKDNLSTSARVYRAAGDDFSFGFFIGTVPLIVNTL